MLYDLDHEDLTVLSDEPKSAPVAVMGGGLQVKPHLGGINWRLVMKHRFDRPVPQSEATQPFAAPSEDTTRMVTVRKEAGRPAPRMGRWEIFDEPKLRRMRIYHVLAFAAGVVVATLLCYGNFIAPMAGKIAALEVREAELTKTVALFEEQAEEPAETVATIEEIVAAPPNRPAAKPQPVASIVSGAALDAPQKEDRRRPIGDDPRNYYDTAIDTGY